MARINAANFWGRVRNLRLRPGKGKRFNRRRVGALLVIALVVLMGAAEAGSVRTTPQRAAPELQPYGSAGDPTSSDKSDSPYYNTSTPQPAQPDRQPPTNQSDSPAAGASASSPALQSQATQNWDRMIIRTGTLQLNVKDVLVAADQIRALAQSHAGYVTQSDSRQEGDYTVATITIQVPAREFDSIFPELRKLGIKTLQENVTSNDVTDEYTDLQSQLRNLQATEQRLLALQAKASTLQDVLTIDQQLREVEGNIEQIQGRVNYLSKSSDMSTITISLFPDMLVAAPPPQPAVGWNPLDIAAKAWNASLELLSGVANVIITAVVFMWWAIPLLLLAAWLAIRPRRPSTPPTTPATTGSQS